MERNLDKSRQGAWAHRSLSLLPYFTVLAPPFTLIDPFFCLFFIVSSCNFQSKHPSLFRLSHPTPRETSSPLALRLPPPPNVDPSQPGPGPDLKVAALPVLGTSPPRLLPFLSYLLSAIYRPLLTARCYRHHFRVSPVLNRVIPSAPPSHLSLIRSFTSSITRLL
ncbi:hypothetical protein LY76DRAFT_55171 [Colletotrichum caudatum]|nr:hypothetical protein LY76DRAFT_55171 [Colletotrichum caudatum]